MATITKTFTETGSSSYHSTWTVTLNGTNVIASGNTFEVSAPTLTAKYVCSGKDIGSVSIKGRLKQNTELSSYFRYNRYGSNQNDPISMTSGTTYTIPPDIDVLTLNTGDYFNTNNKTSLIETFLFQKDYVGFISSKSGDTNYWGYYFLSSTEDYGPILTVTLNAPPSFTSSTIRYDSSLIYPGTVASVSVVNSNAKYDGYITKLEFIVGNDNVVKTFTENNQPNYSETLSLTLTTSGIFSPIIKVTDSRGQVTTRTLSDIVVLKSFTKGDYKYYTINNTNYVRAKVVDNTKSTYEAIPSTILEDGELYKVVSLGESTLGPDSGCFSGCTNLTQFPKIPNGIISMDYSFCGGITFGSNVDINIPDSVLSMQGCFSGAHLPYIPRFPKKVISLRECFSNTSFTDIDWFLFDNNFIPDSVEDMTECFTWSNIESCPYIPPNVKYLDNCFNQCQNFGGDNYGDVYIAALPKSATGIFDYIQNNIYVVTTTDTGNRNFWKTIANNYQDVSVLSNKVLSDKGQFVYWLDIDEIECTVYTIREVYEILPEEVFVDNSSYIITDMNAYYVNPEARGSLVRFPVIPSTVNNVSSMFEDCENLEGTIIVRNEPEEYNYVFDGTVKDIYLYSNNENSVWKTIANNYSNVHFVESNHTLNINSDINSVYFGEGSSNYSNTVNFNYDTELKDSFFYIYNDELFNLLVNIGWAYTEELI